MQDISKYGKWTRKLAKSGPADTFTTKDGKVWTVERVGTDYSVMSPGGHKVAFHKMMGEARDHLADAIANLYRNTGVA